MILEWSTKKKLISIVQIVHNRDNTAAHNRLYFILHTNKAPQSRPQSYKQFFFTVFFLYK